MDGSCFRSVVKELSRTGWSYVSVSDSGQELGHVYAPLASPLPQTAQAGEFGACTAACQNAVAPSRGYSDCQNVVDLWAGSRAQHLAYNKCFYGMFGWTADSQMGPIHKVKGHLTAEQAEGDDFLTFSKIGNDLADHYAKLGALAHEKPSPEQTEWLDKCIAVSRMVCKLAARLLPTWPSCDLSAATRAKVAPPPSPVRAQHRWKRVGQVWQCNHCLKVCRGPWPRNLSACTKRHRLEVDTLLGLGHQCLGLSCSDGGIVCICVRCKAYSTGNYARYLGQKCLGHPRTPASARQYWSRVTSGRHPKLNDVWLDADALSVVRLFGFD